VVGRYSPEEIYSTKREQIEREIRDDVSQKLDARYSWISRAASASVGRASIIA
jgi:hypothetical protein